MKIEFDPAKSARNVELRGLAFERVAEFDFDSAQIVTDERHEYGEKQYRAIGSCATKSQPWCTPCGMKHFG